MIILDKKKFLATSAGATLVVAGVVIKNSLEQSGNTDANLQMLGKALFVVGWVVIAYSIAMNVMNYTVRRNMRSAMVAAACLSIVVVVMEMKKVMKAGNEPPAWMPMLFAGSWFALGLLAGFNKRNRIIGVLAAACVSISMLMVLPWQRKNGVVDGPGMVMFTLGWVSLAFANSLLVF
jgi:hypothetical protein